MSHAIALPQSTAASLGQMDPLQLATMGFLARYRGKTLKAYTLDLKSYFAWCRLHGLLPLQATRPHLELFIRWMEQVPYSSATINRRFNTVALFYKYALRDEIIVKDPAAYIDRPRIDRDGQRRTFLAPLQHGQFMAEAANHGVMSHALACLLGMRGMRIGSACSLDVGDVHQEQGYDVVVFIAKGGKLTTQALPVPAMRAVRAAIGARTEGPLLLNSRAAAGWTAAPPAGSSRRSPQPPRWTRTSPRTACAGRSSPPAWRRASRPATCSSLPVTLRSTRR